MNFYSVNAKSVHDLTKRAQNELGPRMARRMLAAGKQAAKYEIETHPYTNRTGDLQRSTAAFISYGTDTVTLILWMEMFYASFVNDLGYSHIEDAAEKCGEWIERGFQTMPVRIVTGSPLAN